MSKQPFAIKVSECSLKTREEAGQMKKRIIPILLIAAVATAVVAYRATRPDLDHGTLAISGNIEITDVEVAFRVPGRVVERRVSEGETLQAGQVVAVLDDTEFAHEVGRRRAELGAATARLAELTAGYRTEEIAQARAALTRVEAEAVRAEVEFERQQDLLAREVISEREFEIAETAVASRWPRSKSWPEAATARARTAPGADRAGTAAGQAGRRGAGARRDAPVLHDPDRTVIRSRARRTRGAGRARRRRHTGGDGRRSGHRLAPGLHRRDRPGPRQGGPAVRVSRPTPIRTRPTPAP